MEPAIYHCCFKVKIPRVNRGFSGYYFFATLAAAFGLRAFLFLPYEPIASLPLRDFLSPLPIILKFYSKGIMNKTVLQMPCFYSIENNVILASLLKLNY